MNPVKFPEANKLMGGGQPQYRPLPMAIRLENPLDLNSTKKQTCRYQLTPLEMQQFLAAEGCFYLSQFGRIFQPILPEVSSPFGVCPITFKINEDGTYNFWIPGNADKPHEPQRITELENIPLEAAMRCIMETTGLLPEQHGFIEKPSFGLDANGLIVGL